MPKSAQVVRPWLTGASTASLSIVVLAAIGLHVSSAAIGQPPGSPPAAPLTVELGRLVDALASHNRPAEIVENFAVSNIDGMRHLVDGNNLPLFSEDYDWADQQRVLEACDRLVKRQGGDLWPCLVEHLGDKRYAFTCLLNDRGANITVGNFCSVIAYRDLVEPFRAVWPNEANFPVGGAISMKHQLFIAPPCHDLARWCHARRSKPLWELQIELGEWGIRMIESLKDVPEDQKAVLIKRTRAVIDGLRRTKTPIVQNRFSPYSEDAHYLNAREAKEIREEYRNRVSAGLKPQPDTKTDIEGSTYLGKTLDEWTRLAKSKDPRVRSYAAQALGVMGLAPGNTKSASLVLVGLLKDQALPVRRAAITAFTILGSVPKAAVPALIGLLSDEDRGLREVAAVMLGDLGPDAKPAVPALKRLLNDKDESVRLAAHDALQKIEGSKRENP
jgi:hypothetical protein